MTIQTTKQIAMTAAAELHWCVMGTNFGGSVISTEKLGLDYQSSNRQPKQFVNLEDTNTG